jgi:type IV secretion system protein VirD4
MASVLTRLLAALRGSVISAPGGRDVLKYEPQVRVRQRQSANAPVASPVDRNTRMSGLRVKRLRQIAAFYADGANEAVVTIGDCAFVPHDRFHTAAEHIVRAAGDGATSLVATENALRKGLLKRRLGELTDRERAILRAADLLCELGELERTAALRLRLPIVWNEGHCRVAAPGFESLARRNFLRTGMEALFGDFAVAAPESLDGLRRAWRSALSLDARLTEEEHQTLESYQFVERAWLAPAEPVDIRAAATALTFGLFPGTDRPMLYDQGHGIITFAPPATGKRAGQIVQNLSRLTAGAVAIDIDGKAFNATARWRQKEVGKIFVFAPSLAEHSMRYNPIDAVARDPDNAWTEARLLADLLTGRRGPDEEGRNFITPAIFDVALSDRPERRHLRGVIARIACTDQQLESWAATLARSPYRELVEHGRMLRELKPAARQTLVNRLMRELAVWQTPPIADLVDRSDWTPADLRRHATLFLCIDRPDLDRHACVLRVIVGQTLAALRRDKAVAPSAAVTFFLDELARLGPMATVARAVDAAVDSGVRPWLFFADSAEMRRHYPNADAMIAACAAHCYIAPDRAAAHEIGQRLGFVKSLFGAEERPMVTAEELTGPEFADKIIALVRDEAPARLVAPTELKTAQRRGK